jgi:hypothetical protein
MLKTSHTHVHIINHINQVINEGYPELLHQPLLSGTVTMKAWSVIDEMTISCGIITVNYSFARYPCPLHLFVEEQNNLSYASPKALFFDQKC